MAAPLYPAQHSTTLGEHARTLLIGTAGYQVVWINLPMPLLLLSLLLLCWMLALMLWWPAALLLLVLLPCRLGVLLTALLQLPKLLLIPGGSMLLLLLILLDGMLGNPWRLLPLLLLPLMALLLLPGMLCLPECRLVGVLLGVTAGPVALLLSCSCALSKTVGLPRVVAAVQLSRVLSCLLAMILMLSVLP